MSRGANRLRLSGLLGIALGALFGDLQYAYRSPMMLGGSQASPAWMVATPSTSSGRRSSRCSRRSPSMTCSGVPERGGRTVRRRPLGEPLSIYLVEGLQFGPGGLIGQLAALLNLLPFPAFAVNYYRNAWGSAGE